MDRAGNETEWRAEVHAGVPSPMVDFGMFDHELFAHNHNPGGGCSSPRGNSMWRTSGNHTSSTPFPPAKRQRRRRRRRRSDSSSSGTSDSGTSGSTITLTTAVPPLPPPQLTLLASTTTTTTTTSPPLTDTNLASCVGSLVSDYGCIRNNRRTARQLRELWLPTLPPALRTCDLEGVMQQCSRMGKRVYVGPVERERADEKWRVWCEERASLGSGGAAGGGGVGVLPVTTVVPPPLTVPSRAKETSTSSSASSTFLRGSTASLSSASLFTSTTPSIASTLPLDSARIYIVAAKSPDFEQLANQEGYQVLTMWVSMLEPSVDGARIYLVAAKSPDFELLANQKGYLVLTTWGSSSDLKPTDPYAYPYPFSYNL